MRSTRCGTGGRLASGTFADVPIPLASRSIWLASVHLHTIGPFACSARNFSPPCESAVRRRRLPAVCFWKGCCLPFTALTSTSGILCKKDLFFFFFLLTIAMFQKQNDCDDTTNTEDLAYLK